MKNFFENISDLLRTGQTAALVIIIKTKGSTPRKPGAKMIVLRDGKTIGTMGGGDLERGVIEEAMEAIKQGAKNSVFYVGY